MTMQMNKKKEKEHK